MAYEIPQKLEYKEKIMFGLTFRQLIYAFIFLPLIAFIFFRTEMHLVLKIVISTALAGLGIGFVFLDLDVYLKSWISWYRTKKIEKLSKLAKFIPIKEVSNDLIITSDSRKLAVLKIYPINFSIKPEESKEAIAIAFQKFLNSLDFPIQIVMNTETLNLHDYFNELEKRVNQSERFKILFQDYKEHLEAITKQNNVTNRSFYILIPEKSDINIQLQICQSKLSNIGLKNYRLKDREITLFLKGFFDTEEGFFPLKILNCSSYLSLVKREEIIDEKTQEKS